MPTVAEMLRSAREQRQWTIPQVAELTKIKTEHVRDLEAGVYDSFPAPVYIRGFVRTYAATLKLNVGEVLRTLDAELAQTKEFREPPSLSGRDRSWLDSVTLLFSRLNWRIALPIAGLIVIVLVSQWTWNLWQRRTQRDPLANVPPAVYAGPSSEAEILPVPTTNLTVAAPAPGTRR